MFATPRLRRLALPLACLAAAGACDDDAEPTETTPPRAVSFEQAEVRLAGAGCVAEVSVQTTSGESGGVTFGTDQPDLLGFHTVTPRTGTTSWRFAGLWARGAGTARVIATFRSGEADTVPVYVGVGTGSVELSAAFARLAVGDTAVIPFAARGACSNPVYPLSISAADDAPTRFHTPTPHVLALVDSVYRYDARTPGQQRVRVVGRASGAGVLVATYRGATDTVRIIVP